MKTLCVAILLSLAALASCQSHDLALGQATYGDVIIYKADEIKYAFPMFTRTTVIHYPEPGQSNYAVIRAIYIKDNYRDGSGGYATIGAGGVGQKFVKIKLKSQRGGGLNFTTTIYGRYV